MARGIESILNDRRVLDWGNKILKLEPDSVPLVVVSKALGKEEAKNQVFINFEDRPYERWMYISSWTAGATDIAEIELNSESDGSGDDMGGYVNVGDLLLDWTKQDYMYVKSIVRGTPDVLTVVYNYSDMGTDGLETATDGRKFNTSDTTDSGIGGHAAGDRVLKVSNTWEDGGTSAPAIALNLTKEFNFCQKFETSYQVDREIMIAELNGEPELKRLQARKAIEHLKDIEYQLILGKKDARVYEGARADSAGKYIYTTGGLYFMGLTADDISGIGGNITETAFRSFLRQGFRHGPNEKLMLMGGLLTEAVDVWSMGRLQTKEDTTKTGLHIKQYLMAGGTADLVSHPLLEDELEGIGFLLDMSLLKWKVFDDTKLRTGIQANDAQERKDEYMTQVGLKLGLREHHRMIKGVTGIAG